MPELLVATTNAGKVRELLAPAGWTLTPLSPDIDEYVETGTTFADNARGKALYYSSLTGLPALADDSGLQIDALEGEPGVYSARYIDPAISQEERNRRVLRQLDGVAIANRGARFVCHLALAHGGRVIHETTGVCKGLMATHAAGSHGFGYDPIFVDKETERTFAELTADEKSARSHRGRAVRAMARWLRNWTPPPS